MIYGVRITSGQEHIILEVIDNKLKKGYEGIYSVLIFPDVKGYIFIEAQDLVVCKKFVQGIPHIKEVLPKEISLEEILSIAKVKIEEMKFLEGDIVEFTSGPFRGERAKVTKIDEAKDVLTVELVNAPVPVPIVAKASTLKLIQREEKEEKEEKEE
ncbi:MAG: transcription elongation factor Spt5 [Candidatus Micrarchaeia archaeon]